jgi:hypothetical protein
MQIVECAGFRKQVFLFANSAAFRIEVGTMRQILGLAGALLICAGCGPNSGGSVSGNVTLNGQPLAKGQISFLGEGAGTGTGGASIVAGKYNVKDLPPGKYHVQIAGEPENKFIEPNSPDAQRTLSDEEVAAMMDPLPKGTTGREHSLEVTAGEQTKDFALEAPQAP